MWSYQLPTQHLSRGQADAEVTGRHEMSASSQYRVPVRTLLLCLACVFFRSFVGPSLCFCFLLRRMGTNIRMDKNMLGMMTLTGNLTPMWGSDMSTKGRLYSQPGCWLKLTHLHICALRQFQLGCRTHRCSRGQRQRELVRGFIVYTA